MPRSLVAFSTLVAFARQALLLGAVGACGAVGWLVAVAILIPAGAARADESPAATSPPLSDAEEAAAEAAAREAAEPPPGAKFMLRHDYHLGETVRWKVTHAVTVETTIQGVTQIAKTNSASTKAWKITAVDEQGHMTFTHQVDDVEMWQKHSDRQAVERYNSRLDTTPPAAYAKIAETVGVPLATITITPWGAETKREGDKAKFQSAISDLTVPLPEEEIEIGHHWAVPHEVSVRLPDGQVKAIKTRQLYWLDEVVGELATIRVKTQVLTPVDDPRVRAQLVQRMQQGVIRFHLGEGRMVSKEMKLNETVIGFNGAESRMDYQAEFEERLIEDRTARKP